MVNGRVRSEAAWITLLIIASPRPGKVGVGITASLR